MQKTVVGTAAQADRSAVLLRNVAIVVAASLFMGICGRMSVPLPFTPIPFTLANFGVLLVGLTLGPARGFAALTLYLAEGAMGMPVFSPAGPGGVAQLLGPTGGYLMSYPFVALLAGWIGGDARSFARNLLASITGELLLFAIGVSWLMLLSHARFMQ